MWMCTSTVKTRVWYKPACNTRCNVGMARTGGNKQEKGKKRRFSSTYNPSEESSPRAFICSAVNIQLSSVSLALSHESPLLEIFFHRKTFSVPQSKVHSWCCNPKGQMTTSLGMFSPVASMARQGTPASDQCHWYAPADGHSSLALSGGTIVSATTTSANIKEIQRGTRNRFLFCL